MRKKIVKEAIEESACSSAYDSCLVDFEFSEEREGSVIESNVGLHKEEQEHTNNQEIQCELGNECYRNMVTESSDDRMDENNVLRFSFTLTESLSGSEFDEQAELRNAHVKKNPFSSYRFSWKIFFYLMRVSASVVCFLLKMW